MASLPSIHPHVPLRICRNSSCGTWCARKTSTLSACKSLRRHMNLDRFRTYGVSGTNFMHRFLTTYFTSHFLPYSSRWPGPIMASVGRLDYCAGESCKAWVLEILHESARITSVSIKHQQSVKSYPRLANAWVGVDVDVWQRHISYQSAIYALLKTLIEMPSMLSNDRVHKILSPKVSLILESLEEQLRKRDQKLVNWFSMEQLPILIQTTNPVLEMCASEYAKSGIPVDILPLVCCVTIRDLNSRLFPHRACFSTLQDTIWQLVDSFPGFASIDILYHLSTKFGVENEFLAYFGGKVLHHDVRGNIIFWMGLLQEKLVAAFFRENVVRNLQNVCHTKVPPRDLVVIGLLAFLGRKTRLFLAQKGIKDLDEPVKDFICYLECGMLFIYPDLSSLFVYELFMEVVSDEIGWLDLYAAVACTRYQERKRLKTIQAEKEIIMSTVFGVCSDMFSSLVHYNDKTEQSLGANVAEYLYTSKDLLTVCIEDYWAAYDRLHELGETMQVQFPEPVMRQGCLLKIIPPLLLKEPHQRLGDLMSKRISEATNQHMLEASKSNCSDKILQKLPEAVETKIHRTLFAKSSNSLLSTTSDILMGTRLLLVDLRVTVGLIHKQIFVYTLSKMEIKKISRTVIDFACVIPIAILMLLPVTVIGHAAILTSIKKYLPGLIPSPYSAVRLDVIKQLKRAKKMKRQSCSNPNTLCPSPAC